MNSKLLNVNLKVAVLDSDLYAMQAINGYLAWDRRTRVKHKTTNEAELWKYLADTPLAEQPDVVVLDADHPNDAEQLAQRLKRILSYVPKAHIVCLVQSVQCRLSETAAELGARAVLLKQEVGMQIAWAIVYTLAHDFLVTQSIAKQCRTSPNRRLLNAAILPEQRDYPEMTDRVRQAIQLCVVEGMPAQVAADEMGISLHTIRGYIKEGYRILEAYDPLEYPSDMSPQEKAFMRFTAPSDKNKLAE